MRLSNLLFGNEQHVGVAIGRADPRFVFLQDARCRKVVVELAGALVGKLVLENEFLKGASRDAPRPRSETMSVIAGPVVSRSPKDAG